MLRELRWLLRQALPLRDLYALRLGSVVLGSMLSMVDPLLLKWLIDGILAWRQADMLPLVAAAFFALFFFRFTFASLNRLLDLYTAERLTFDVRRRLLAHLQRLSGDFYLLRSSGELLQRLENDVEQVAMLGGATLASLLRIVVTSTLTITVMCLLDWQLALLVVPLLPAMALLRRLGRRRLQGASDRVQATTGERYAILEAQLSNMTQVQLLNRQAGEKRRYAAAGRRTLQEKMRRRVLEQGLSFTYQLTLTAAGAAVLAFGGYRVLEGALTVGGLVAFHAYLVRLFEPMDVVVFLYSELIRASASIRRLLELEGAEPSVTEPADPLPLPLDAPPDIRLRDVHFAYQPDEPVLRGLNLDIPAGRIVALAGESGAGKSTVARLLTRQVEVHRGGVEIAGVPISRVRLRQLRRRVALVPQDPVLFDVSLRQNLLYADPAATDADLHRALALAQMETAVAAWDEGLDLRVGVRGERLSGGQRQRVALARAILQKAPVLILDEASSALDGFTEHRLLQGLRGALRDRTVIVIAHRPSAILWADWIVMMEAGRVMDQGTHAELQRRSAHYRDLMSDKPSAHADFALVSKGEDRSQPSAAAERGRR